MKKNLIVLQEGNKDCGSACLLSIIRHYGGDVSLDRLVEMTKTTKEGTNFYNLQVASQAFGLESRCYKVDDINKVKVLTTPIIAQINNNSAKHFVVIYKITDQKITIMDPGCGKVITDLFDFCNMWTGYIMVFEKTRSLPCLTEDHPLNKIIIQTIIKNKSVITFLLILSIIFTSLSCLASFYSEIIFDYVLDTKLSNLILVTIVFSVLYIIKGITNYTRNHLIIYLNQKLDVSILLSTFSKIILLPYRYYKNKTTSEVLSRINDLSHIKSFISKIIVTVFLDTITFVVSLSIIYSISKDVLTLLAVSLVLYSLVMMIANNFVKKLTNKLQEDSANLNNTIIESVSSFETVKGLNIEDNTIINFSNSYSRTLNTSYKLETINNFILSTKDVIGDFTLLLINFLIFKQIMNGTLTIGNYMTITFLTGYIIYPIQNIINLLGEYHYTRNTIKRANNLLEIGEEKIYQKPKLKVEGNIIVKNLSYSYNDKNYVLNNLSLYFKNSEKVLVLGSSGSGKSTFLKLLYKYYHVGRDKIFIGNYDINDYSLSDIRKNMTYISQNEQLYTGTIRDNILLGRNIPEEEYLNICKITHVDEIIKDSILGYDYLLEENGINISGGQRQRIILARSLLKDSSIIMIDEGLNQIDIQLEKIILENVFNYFKDKTFIIISHRRENSFLYDRLIEIEKGTLKNNLIRSKR